MIRAVVVLALAAGTVAQTPEEAARGAELYGRQCAVCHGLTGRGDGPAAYLLDPKPRNFAAGTFRVVSTEDGVPTDEDLLTTLRRGMPGSAMPPWSHLSEADLRGLVAEVRRFVLEGRATDAMAEDDTLTREEALADALELYGTPGDPALIPARPDEGIIDLALGQELYRRSCAACHGEDGRARVPVEKLDSDGYPIGARDFTRGIFKGGRRGEDIARRIWLGMPGTPMPSLPLKQRELWSLVAFIEGLSSGQDESRVLQVPSVLVARRVDEPLSLDPEATSWVGVEPTWLAVTPLWWRHDRIEGLSVQALHDGQQLALRLSWDDATCDDELLRQQSFGDAVAVQLSAESDPPFFGMGDASAPVDLWHWKAVWQRDASGRPELVAAFPNLPAGSLDERGPAEEVFETATAVGNPLSAAEPGRTVESATARGQGTLSTRPILDRAVQGRGRWSAGRWSVVLLRDLAPPEHEAEAAVVTLRPGGSSSVAFAVWDGSAGDRNGSKSVTIWHRLALEY
ncbi:MAG: ethylbenzene dehydrogenase-related protein [Planctomycetota bacterium]